MASATTLVEIKVYSAMKLYLIKLVQRTNSVKPTIIC